MKKNLIYEFVDEAITKILNDDSVASAKYFSGMCECGVTEIAIMIVTPKLADIAQKAIAEALGNDDYVETDSRFDDKVE